MDHNADAAHGPDVAAMLRARIGDLARHLFPGEENESMSSKAQLRFRKKGSLAVEIDGEKAGTFYDHEAAFGGDALILVKHKLGLDTREAFAWASNWLGVERPSSGGWKEKTREEKLADIIGQSGPLNNTAAERYLQKRGIDTAKLPDCLRFRPKAYKRYGALVAFSTDEAGNILASQQIYVSEDGMKPGLAVSKRTNRTAQDWPKRANVRFPGKEPIILAEGVETALSVWQATGQETRACLGVANIAKAPLPKGASVIIARDGDAPGSSADTQLHKAVARLKKRYLRVAVAVPPEGKDFNDILVESGEEAVREMIANVSFSDGSDGDGESDLKKLRIGSDVEMAKRVREDLIDEYGPVVYSESYFWRYTGTHWEPIPEEELQCAVHPYDGALFETPGGEMSQVRLNNSRIVSSLKQLSWMLAKPRFFFEPDKGVNCASGFIRLAEDGTVSIEPHNREHRCRHTLPGHWQPGAPGLPPEGSLFRRLLDGVFQGDAEKQEKIELIGEVFAAAAFRIATSLTQPKAVVFHGLKANNGKSQFLDVLRGLFPPEATCSMSAARMTDERHVVWLVGKLLNASDELSSSAAVASDVFKKIIVGDVVDGRDVFKSRAEFRAEAQHVFATNTLPSFQGGMDSGIERRLLVLPFSRIIPSKEMLGHIGAKIAKDEADLVLAWVVESGIRLIRRMEFQEPQSCKHALRDWIAGADPVVGWLCECVDFMEEKDGFPAPVSTRKAYDLFTEWAIREGYKKDRIPAINGFVQRVKSKAGEGFETRRRSERNYFHGFYIKKTAMECD